MANGGDFVQIMADNPQKRPSKGILKTSTSFEKQGKNSKKSKPKATKWDEMNIIATLHPPDKDYGHMKIEEPKTPYNWDMGDEDDIDGQPQHTLDPEELASKLKGKLDRSRKDTFENDSDDSDNDLTAEELARRKVFKSKRKMHYNEFKVVEFARKLIKADEEALDNDDSDNEEKPSSSTKTRIEEEEREDEEKMKEDEERKNVENEDGEKTDDEEGFSDPVRSEIKNTEEYF